MPYTFFTIPIADDGKAQQALNSFCAQHRVARVDKHFVADGAGSFWAICVTTADGQAPMSMGSRNTGNQKPKVDYREVLSESEFAVFAKLRELRKSLAEREGVPAYALFTNEQLAKAVQGRVCSKAGLQAIDGIGAGRIDKYGEQLLQLLVHEVPQLEAPARAEA
jgi:superfamily II DNA helicase RecQ